MNFADYDAARQGYGIGDEFDGKRTREAIEKFLGVYTKSSQLSAELIRWGQALLGDGIFNGIDESKWKFVSL